MTKTVLLYGDSIIWGVDASIGGRHLRQNRIDTIVQQSLGSEVEVIGEGHRGRTMFGENGYFPKRDGLVQFGPIFASHLPIDVLVIMLGTNDLNSKTRHSAADIADALTSYETEAKEWCDFMGYQLPRILVVSPPDIDESSLVRFAEIFADSASLVADTVEQLRLLSEQSGYSFLDSRSVAQSVSTDGIHLNVEQTKKLADAIAYQVTELLS